MFPSYLDHFVTRNNSEEKRISISFNFERALIIPKTKQKKAKLEEKRELQWSNFNLPNIPLFQTRLPNDIQIRLWDYVAAKTKTQSSS